MHLFRHAKTPLRYFLYTSDAKLDMLFEQIDPDLRRHLSAEAKVDLKIASVTLRQAERSSAARIAKLRMVEQYIDANHHVGTVSSPGQEYFRGSMAMRWGWLSGDRDDGTSGRRDTVFFKGQDGQGLVMLTGSRRHVLGQQLASQVVGDGWAVSAMPAILAVIAASIAVGHRKRGRYLGSRPPIMGWSNEAATAQSPSEESLQAAASLNIPGPEQYVEFLAVPLIQGEVTGPDFACPLHAVLATPVYVAMASRPAPVIP